MSRLGFQVADLSVDIEGAGGPFAQRETFAPTGKATLTLRAEEGGKCLRPTGDPVVECDTWAAFRNGQLLSLVSQIPVLSPPEVARIDLDETGASGTIVLRPGLDADPLVYPLDQLLMIHLLEQHGGLLLHAACIVHGGRAAVVAGPSGEGKTTFARAASALPGVTVLTDERVVLRKRGQRWFAYGTPWAGEGKFSHEGCAPLAGVFLLDKSDSVEVSPMSPVRAMAGLVRTHFPAGWTGDTSTQLRAVEELALEVPCYRLRTRLGGDAHQKVVEAISIASGCLSADERRGGLIAELLRSGQTARFSAFGNSMAPAILGGARLTVEPVSTEEVQVGDVVVFRSRGRLVAHRAVALNPLQTRGDALAFVDPPGDVEILGRVTSVRSPGRLRRICTKMARRMRVFLCRS